MKAASVNVPNIIEISLHVSESVVKYHALQVPGWPAGTIEGLTVTLGKIGVKPLTAMQYQ